MRYSALILCLWISINCAKAQVVRLTVELETVIWDSRGPEMHSQTSTNDCLVSTNAWFITGDPFGSLQWSSSTNFIGQSKRRLDSPNGNPGRPPREPDTLTDMGKISWLAFCSGPFFKQNRKDVPLPSDFWKEYLPASWQTSEKITLFEDDLGLPERIVLRHNDQPVLQYRATMTTNVGDWTFPLQFYLAQYLPAGTNAWQLHLSAKGRITNIDEAVVENPAAEQKH
jgi:hypothetical protein